ncbi:MAG: hypothetical protein ACK5IQ_10605 [Bacteroidales bacterium]
MYKRLLVPNILLLLLVITSCTNDKMSISSNYLSLEVNTKGQLVKLEDISTGVNYLFEGDSSYFLQLESSGKTVQPSSTSAKGNRLIFYFDTLDATATLAFKQYPSYLTFELISLESTNKIENVIWGAYKVKLTDKVGQSLGVAYNDEFAIGLMGLNLKSCGGFEIIPRERFGNTAQKMGNYTSLQGFTRNRAEARVQNSCLQELTQTVAILDSDSTLIGSRFAIYGI